MKRRNFLKSLLGGTAIAAIPVHPDKLKDLDESNKDNLSNDYDAEDLKFAELEFSTPPLVYELIFQKQLATGQNDIVKALEGVYFPGINKFDNHEAHLFQHRKYLRDHYWKYMGQDEFRIFIRCMFAHIEQHEKMIETGRVKHVNESSTIDFSFDDDRLGYGLGDSDDFDWIAELDKRKGPTIYQDMI